MTDKQRELLKKLQALAERGVGGEKETAERKLKQLIKKYGIKEEELSEVKIMDFDFKYHSKWEKKLLRQLFYRMFGLEFQKKTYAYRFGPGSKSIYGITCTQAEGMQLQIEYDFYKAIWEEELDLFQQAFIQKHCIFDPNGGSDDTELTLEEIERILRMQQLMSGMQDKTMNPLIEEK